MSYLSMSFAGFVAIALVFFYLLPKHRLIILVGSSLVFALIWSWGSIIYLLYTAIVCASVAKLFQQSKKIPYKKYWLTLGILGVCVPLVYTKYISPLINYPKIPLLLPFNGIAPLGISYITLQAISYLKWQYQHKKIISPSVTSLYLAFFPKTIAGPIEEPGRFFSQLKQLYRIRHQDISSGLQLILWGVYKKAVIADRLTVYYVEPLFSNPNQFSGLTSLISIYCLAIQIYADFSGYTDVARGIALLFGIKLRSNFYLPYLASDLRVFWKRWHISFYQWLVTNIYIPLGGSRVVSWKLLGNLAVVFLVSGLWHGAKWTYVLWGMYHAVAMFVWIVIAKYSKTRLANINTSVSGLVSIGITFHIVTFGWVLFRSDSVSEIFAIFAGLLTTTTGSFGIPGNIHLLNCLLLGPLFFCEFITIRYSLKKWFNSQQSVVKFCVYTFLVLAIINLGISQSIPFIYGRF